MRHHCRFTCMQALLVALIIALNIHRFSKFTALILDVDDQRTLMLNQVELEQSKKSKDNQTIAPALRHDRSICRALQSLTGGVDRDDNNHMASPSALWRSPVFATALREASIMGNDVKVNITSWIQDYLFPFYQRPGTMSESVGHGMSIAESKRLLQILEEGNEPIQIYVFGGSVAGGGGCLTHPGPIQQKPSGDMERECAWPSRLEHILNELLSTIFVAGSRKRGADDVTPEKLSNNEASNQSEIKESNTATALQRRTSETPSKGKRKFVKIYNAAVPGTGSDTGSMALKYELFQNDELRANPPHMVLLAYSPNDGLTLTPEDFRTIHMPTMIQAARDMRPCDNELPVVGMVHDFFPDHNPELQTVSKMHVHSGSSYSLATWHRTMLVDFAAVVQHAVLTHGDGNEKSINPLMGSKLGVHMGTGSHVGMAWTVLYNLLHAAVEACADGGHQVDSIVRPQSSEFAPSVDPGKPQLFSRIDSKTLPSSVHKDYHESLNIQNKRCYHDDKNLFGTSPPVCAYAWMVNRLAKITLPKHVEARLKKYRTHNDGWVATGSVFKNPRTGYYAEKQGATFTLTIPNITVDVHYLTILSMKSYGPTFVDSILKMEVNAIDGSSSRPSSVRSNSTFHVSGYHETHTSVQLPHTFRLSGAGAERGDTIVLKATLVSGSTFKVAGLALCTY